MMTDARYYAESDGGDTYVGGYTSYQPKTYYVVDTVEGERIDCDTWGEAQKLARKLNREHEQSGIARMFRDEENRKAQP